MGLPADNASFVVGWGSTPPLPTVAHSRHCADPPVALKHQGHRPDALNAAPVAGSPQERRHVPRYLARPRLVFWNGRALRRAGNNGSK